MRSTYLYRGSLTLLFNVALYICPVVYAYSSSDPSQKPSSYPQAQDRALAFRDRNEDKSLYHRNYYKYDWDYRENWRYDRDDYLKGGNQPPIYREDGSYAPTDDHNEEHYLNAGNELAVVYTTPVTPYTNYTYMPTETPSSYSNNSAGYNPSPNPSYSASTNPSTYNYIPVGTAYYPSNPYYSSGMGYPTNSGHYQENNYQTNRYNANPNSNLEYGGQMRYNIGTNDVEKPSSELYQTNNPYNPNPVYYTIYPSATNGYPNYGGYYPGYNGYYPNTPQTNKR